MRAEGRRLLGAVCLAGSLALLLACLAVTPQQPVELKGPKHVACTKAGCIEYDGNPAHLPKMPDMPSARHLGLLGKIGGSDVENYAGSLAVAGVKGYHGYVAQHHKPHASRAKHLRKGLKVAKGQQQLRIFGFRDGSENEADHNPEHEKYWISDDKNWNNVDLKAKNAYAPEWWAKGRGSSPEPVVVWGSAYRGEDMNEVNQDDEKLTRRGVNVEGKDGLVKMLPLPNLDDTEYSMSSHAGRLPPKNAEDEQAREAKSDRKLQKAGVLVEGSKIKLFPAPEYPKESYFHKVDDLGDRIVRRSRCTYAKLDSIAGMQKRHSYLADANFPKSEKESKDALEKAGVKVWGLQDLKSGAPWPPYHMPGGGCYAEDY